LCGIFCRDDAVAIEVDAELKFGIGEFCAAEGQRLLIGNASEVKALCEDFRGA